MAKKTSFSGARVSLGDADASSGMPAVSADLRDEASASAAQRFLPPHPERLSLGSTRFFLRVCEKEMGGSAMNIN